MACSRSMSSAASATGLLSLKIAPGCLGGVESVVSLAALTLSSVSLGAKKLKFRVEAESCRSAGGISEEVTAAFRGVSPNGEGLSSLWDCRCWLLIADDGAEGSNRMSEPPGNSSRVWKCSS